MYSRFDAGAARFIIHQWFFYMTEPESKSTAVTIFADRSFGPGISRFLFGKFTEHLGRNVYGGA
ncbi:MAG TPA: hypothetical protein DIT99_28265 [Candidatus Latescibacteria bacterium]|nr:hypothetical protein [Candidatus Latescibacterota bacterium]